ncbi:arylsulfatase A-like enzyme [Wenyingzhuangia heitensis]|uniref:Arylsulfatase A-like enzyme n=1 Tax=Wenyingzhuangia heitensis TaxID=1487859 RepID=A0ABX0UCW8_9FLAO|nr:sulfatase [Wenyingzhuangia heitensis]NIJ44912.1 arylsulfatase A-like enzyme [Wenyingzhuangia heitensis]
MKRIVLLALVLFTMITSYAQEKPNIVLLFVDDYGWSDIGYRNASFETPNLDQLKKESLDFQRAYIPTPTCSPSRLSLLTGKEAVRLQMVRHIALDPKNPEAKYAMWKTDPVQMPSLNYLPLEETTYAEKIKEYGYYNHFIGKWHLGHEGRYPVDQGFDSEFGTTNAGHPKSYYYPFFKKNEDPKNVLKNFKEGDYLTDELTDNAVDFIKGYNKENPFMLTFWYYSVHGPSIGRKDLLKKYQERGIEGKYADHHAMVEAMDESVGRVKKALEDKGIADNTVIIVLSDQGGAYANDPLRGGKKGGDTLAEGGARVPFMIKYPGITKANTESFVPVQSIDVFPTVVEIASGKKYKNKEIQGVSLMPLLKGKEIKKRNLFGFRSYEDQYTSIVNGDWKMIKYHSGKYQLYNVKTDQSESHDLVGTGLKIEKKLKRDLAKWEKKAVPAFGPDQLKEK